MRVLRALAVLYFALQASASMTTTALTGRVVIGNAPGAGVTVTATSSALPHERTTMTNARGIYWLDALPPGTYDVTFSKAGHTTLTRRAIVELARVARADGKLEPNEDEESVTSTASTLTVAETTAITSTITSEALQRMPLETTANGALKLFSQRRYENDSFDGVPLPFLTPIGEETTDEVTIVHAAAGAEIDRSRDGLIAMQTRSGSDALAMSLRGTFTNDGPLFEGAAGGRILEEKLWFFANAWKGDDAWRGVDDLHGYFGKLSAQPAAAHHIEAEMLDSEASEAVNDSLTIAALRYTGVFGANTTAQAFASHATVPAFNPGTSTVANEGTLSLRASHTLGDHVLSAGATRIETDDAYFVNDRVSIARFTLNAGARYEEDELAPRAALAFDLQGDGRRAFFASWGEYEQRDITTLGFATAIGTTGIARIDAIRREHEDDELRLAANYRLFDRFEAGATLSHTDDDDLGAAWLGAGFPIGDHELGVTLLERYATETFVTDFAARLTVATRVSLRIGVDLTNALDAKFAPERRAARLWIRWFR